RLVQFVHREKGLAGFLVVQGDTKGPVTVKLAPAGTLTGRVVTRAGRPAVGGYVESINTDWFTGNRILPTPPDIGAFPRVPWTDNDGKFRVEGLAPGLKYQLYYKSDSRARRIVGPAAEDPTVKPGQTKDLGDIMIQHLD